MKQSKGLNVLVDLVKAEAKKLRLNSTQEQKDRLSYNSLSALSPQYCIYGQMTGNCYSKEALGLIRKCALRVYDTTKQCSLYDITLRQLNGKPKDFENSLDRKGEYHSPIEIFIAKMTFSDNYDDRENNKTLINYLKGKIDKLEFHFHKKRTHFW